MSAESRYGLAFISDEHLYGHVMETVCKYRHSIDLRDFMGSMPDPIKLSFDSIIYGRSIELVIGDEIARQLDKSNNNHIGYFHQNIFKYFKADGWVVPERGYDIVNLDLGIFVEMKNKHNTMNSSSCKSTYIKMQDTILRNPKATCMLVEVIAAGSQNKVWRVSIDSQRVENERIRRVSIDKFYGIVTGDPLGFKKLCAVLPKVIRDVVHEQEKAEVRNTVLGEMKKINADLLSSIYILSFRNYEGFRNIKVQ